MRRSIVRTAAILVMCVFASLPTLARVHDRLTPHGDTGSFRLSKNLERPHEKIAAVAIAAPAVHVAPDLAWTGDVLERETFPTPPPSLATLPSRAPPVR